MNREKVTKSERNEAVRALLVSQSRKSPAGSTATSGRGGVRGQWFRTRPVAAVAIAVVFAVIAYFGLTAVHTGGLVPAVRPATTASPAINEKPAVGAIIGSWSSDAAPISYGGTVSTGGLAISVTITCSGNGSLFISLSHVSDEDGACSSTGGKPETARGSGGITKPVVVKIRPHDGSPTWKVTVRAVAPTTFTPTPVRATDGKGIPVPYCGSGQLTAKYVHVPAPQGVDSTGYGEVVVTNTGSRLCAVSGHPTGSFVAASGTAIGHHANEETDTKSYSTRAILAPVLMQPGGHAYIQVASGQADKIKGCQPVESSTIRFTGDNSGFSPTVTFTVPIPTTQACSNTAVLQLFATLYVDYPSDLRTPAQITEAATCRLDELTIALRSTPDQAGEQTGAISFTNTGDRSCHLNGTPAVTFVADDGTPTGHHTGVQLHGGDPATLDEGYEVLARGETRYVHFAIENATAVTQCKPATVHSLRTTTGEFGYTKTIALPHAVAACTNTNATQLRATGMIADKNYLLNSLPQG